ncbi:Hypothetical_protein [Hexamita inflata]|uniref:Hypothetical_protein n=1 Tax=Hexamita inflata TaxID=28002 RepID=A0ABP1GGN3_9EUKA
MNKLSESSSQRTNTKLSQETINKIRELFISSKGQLSDSQMAKMLGVSQSAVYKQKKKVLEFNPSIKEDFAPLPTGRSKSYPNEIQCEFIKQFVAVSCCTDYQTTRITMIKYTSMYNKGELDKSDPLMQTYWEIINKFRHCPIPTETQFYNYFDRYNLLQSTVCFNNHIASPSEVQCDKKVISEKEKSPKIPRIQTDMRQINGIDCADIDDIHFKYIMIYIEAFSKFVLHW